MTASWEELAARARGLATQLADEARLSALAAATDLSDLAGAMASLGYTPVWEAGRDLGAALDAAIRRRVGENVRPPLARADVRTPALSVLVEEEERRSISSLVRGAACAAPFADRLAAVLPTATLSAPRLRRLAMAGDVHELARSLRDAGSPWAVALEGFDERPDLLEVERALAQLWALRARADARRAGDRVLREYVERRIDFENAKTVLRLADERVGEGRAARFYLAGGRAISAPDFAEIAGADPAAARDRLLSVLAGSALLAVFGGWLGEAEGCAAMHLAGESVLHERALDAEIALHHRLALAVPLGSAAVLHYMLRVRREALAVIGALSRLSPFGGGGGEAHGTEASVGGAKDGGGEAP